MNEYREQLAKWFEMRATNMRQWSTSAEGTDKKVFEACAIAYQQCAEDVRALDKKTLDAIEHMDDMWMTAGPEFKGVLSQKKEQP